MDSTEWVRIVSWHVLRTFTRAGGGLTLCGRSATQAQVEETYTTDLPAQGKTCESCLRIAARNANA